MPPALSEIVERAMHVLPERRFGDCRELGRALMPFASRRTTALWAGSLGLESKYDSTPPPGTSDGRVPTGSIPAPPGVPAAQTTGSQANVTLQPAKGPSATTGLFVGIAVTAAVAAAAVLMFRGGEPPPPASPPEVVSAPALEPTPPADEPTSYLVDVDVTPDDATIELDGEVVGTGTFSRELLADGSEHRLLIQRDGFIPQSIHFANVAPPRTISLDALAPGTTPSVRERRFVTAERRRTRAAGAVMGMVAPAQAGPETSSAPSNAGASPMAAPEPPDVEGETGSQIRAEPAETAPQPITEQSTDPG